MQYSSTTATPQDSQVDSGECAEAIHSWKFSRCLFPLYLPYCNPFSTAICTRCNFDFFYGLRVVFCVLQVAIDRPNKANAMTSTFFRELRQCIDALAVDPDCRAIVICGAGLLLEKCQ